jgi:hypothetical protein
LQLERLERCADERKRSSILSENDEVMCCISAVARKPEPVRIVVPIRAAGDPGLADARQRDLNPGLHLDQGGDGHSDDAILLVVPTGFEPVSPP